MGIQHLGNSRRAERGEPKGGNVSLLLSKREKEEEGLTIKASQRETSLLRNKENVFGREKKGRRGPGGEMFIAPEMLREAKQPSINKGGL